MQNDTMLDVSSLLPKLIVTSSWGPTNPAMPEIKLSSKPASQGYIRTKLVSMNEIDPWHSLARHAWTLLIHETGLARALLEQNAFLVCRPVVVVGCVLQDPSCRSSRWHQCFLFQNWVNLSYLYYYFDPENVFLDNKNKCFSGWPSWYFGWKGSTGDTYATIITIP